MNQAARKPDIEIKRYHRKGRYRGATTSYAHLYWRPLIVHVLGRTIVGKRHLG